MKKIVSIIFILLVAGISVFAQEEKLCIFIGVYSEIKGDCSDRVLVREAIADREEYHQRSLKFYEEHKGFSPSTEFVSEKQCVIISEFKTDRSVAYKCNPIGFRYFVGSTIEACEKMLENDRALYEKNRSVQPVAVFEHQGTVAAQKVEQEGECGCIQKERMNSTWLGQYWDYVFLCKMGPQKNKVITLSHTSNREEARKLAEQKCAEK